MKYRRWSLRRGVFGIVGDEPGTRWLLVDLWNESVRTYGRPKAIQYFGTKWCWSVGSKHQRWGWKANSWLKLDAYVVVYPRDAHKRWAEAHPHLVGLRDRLDLAHRDDRSSYRWGWHEITEDLPPRRRHRQ